MSLSLKAVDLKRTAKQRIHDKVTTAILKQAGFSLKPKGRERFAGLFVVLIVQEFIGIVMRVMIRDGWKPPQPKKKSKRKK